MNFKPLLKKLEESEQFTDFKKQSPNAELVAGFFILDFKEGRETYNLDYKSDNQIKSFSLTEDLFKENQEEILDKSKPLLKLNPEIEVELQELQAVVEKELEKNDVKGKIEKIIAVLQQNNDKTIWNLTCMIEGMKIMIIHIDAINGEIIKFEKKSLFDFVKPMGK